MTVMGELGHIDAAGLLQLLGSRRATGYLWITADGEEVGVYLSRGALSRVTSTRLSLRLGRILLQRGILQTRQLHEVLRDQQAGFETRSLGELLLVRGWITAETLASCVEEQSVAVLAKAIGARRGTFLYRPDEGPPTGVPSEVLNSNRILQEAIKRVREVQALRAQLPDVSAPLAPAVQIDVTIQSSTPVEDAILKALDAGANSLGELVDIVPVDEPVLLRTVIDMRRRGLIVAGQGDKGGALGVAKQPPPGDDDLERLLSHTL
ncbi:MAG: DUF4388 domain-containing protein [Chloroflexota bacterium]|nr:DUF4388 domain-containing protein [Chloroflexota bacterium]